MTAIQKLADLAMHTQEWEYFLFCWENRIKKIKKSKAASANIGLDDLNKWTQESTTSYDHFRSPFVVIWIRNLDHYYWNLQNLFNRWLCCICHIWWTDNIILIVIEIHYGQIQNMLRKPASDIHRDKYHWNS